MWRKLMSNRIAIPVRLALEMCMNITVEKAVFDKFLAMVISGEIEILPNEQFAKLEASNGN
jgi:hypothetical protein